MAARHGSASSSGVAPSVLPSTMMSAPGGVDANDARQSPLAIAGAGIAPVCDAVVAAVVDGDPTATAAVGDVLAEPVVGVLDPALGVTDPEAGVVDPVVGVVD